MMMGLFLFLGMGISTTFGQTTKTEKFKVYGNCGMCKARIEKAAKTVDGVTVADWNKETKLMEVTFDASKTTAENIQKAISAVGHDTEKFKADDKVYQDLPGCCHYDRTDATKETKSSGM